MLNSELVVIFGQQTITLSKKNLVIQVQAADLALPVNNMTKLKNQLFCRLDGLTSNSRSEQRLSIITELGLLASEAVPIFEETTQRAASFSGVPIGILSLVVGDELCFKSTVGLSSSGMTNPLATQRKISLHESFGVYVVDSQQPLVIENPLSNAVFANSILVQHYGIKTYLGVPLISYSGVCIGTLEVMDWVERSFDDRDLEHITLLARWCLGEFERSQGRENQAGTLITKINQPKWQSSASLLLQSQVSAKTLPNTAPDNESTPVTQDIVEISSNTETNPIKIKLLSQLTQELRTPLTSVIGMASVLHREVYGPLTVKQREYLEIIHDSGQNLITLVDEIVSLGVLSDQDTKLDLVAVDIEMLCQQVINSLTDISKQHQQVLSLSVEPGNRIWSVDKEKIRQALYYLIISILEMSEPGGEVKIHVSKRNEALNIAVGISHPWLGEDFGETKLHSQAVTQALNLNQDLNQTGENCDTEANELTLANRQILTSSALMMVINDENTLDKNTNKIPRDILGLLFCCHLTELHQGKVVVQGSANTSYRYLLQISNAKPNEE